MSRRVGKEGRTAEGYWFYRCVVWGEKKGGREGEEGVGKGDEEI